MTTRPVRSTIRPYQTPKVKVVKRKTFVMLGVNRNIPQDERKNLLGDTRDLEYKKVPKWRITGEGEIDSHSKSPIVERPGSPKGVVSLDTYSNPDLVREKEYMGLSGMPIRDYVERTGDAVVGASDKAHEDLQGGPTGRKVEKMMRGNARGKTLRPDIEKVDI
tara:strand:- start:405 stop:893 length:489 start_codon:yes stop_codon:yes gene_type:complete